jgi:hypothetical protein
MTSSWASVAKSPKVLNATIIPTEITSLDNEGQLVDLNSSKIIPVVSIPSIDLGEFGVSKPKKIKKIKFPLKSSSKLPDAIESTDNLKNDLKPLDNNIIEVVQDVESAKSVDSVVCDVDNGEVLEKSEVDQMVKITETTYIKEAVAKKIELVFETHITKDTNIVTKDTKIVTKDSDIITKDSDIITKDSDIITKDSDIITKDSNIIKDTDVSNSEKIVVNERLFALELCENIKNAEISSFSHLQAESARIAVFNSLKTIDLDSAEKLSNKIYKTVYEKWYTDRRNALKFSNVVNKKDNNNTERDSVVTNKGLPSQQLYSVINDLTTNKVVIENNLSTDEVVMENDLLNIIDTPILNVDDKSSYLTISKKKCVDIKKIIIKDDVVNKNKSIVKNKLVVNKKQPEPSAKQTQEERVILSNVKKEEILSAAKLYARNLINFDEIIAARDSHGIDWRGCLHTISINCHHTKLGVTKSGMPIFPRNFLDNTFIIGTTYSTNSHQIFRKEFLIVLEEHVSDLHIRFEKDNEDPLLFTIKFYNKREAY